MSTDTVSIACKMPHGLKIEVGFRILNNGVVYGENYKTATLKGWNDNNPKNLLMAAPSLLNPDPGITRGVSKDLWEAWLKEGGKNHPAVKNHLIYVLLPDADSAADQMDAAKSLKSGLEPLDPTKLPEGVTEAPVQGRPSMLPGGAKAA